MKRTIILILLPLLLAASCVKEPPGERLAPGETLPQFSTATLTGRSVGTGDLLGKPSLVILFTTTCPDCHRQLPEVESAYRALGDAAAFLAVAREEDRQAVKAFWDANGYTVPVAAPGDRDIYNLFDRGSKSGVPQVYLSDPAGVVLRTADDSAVLPAEEIVRTLAGLAGE